MVYTTFDKSYSDINNEPMFLGKNVNTFRTDIVRYPFLTVDSCESYGCYNKDRKEFNSMTQDKQDFIIKILQFLISINSVQSRGMSIALLQLASLPETESFIQNC